MLELDPAETRLFAFTLEGFLRRRARNGDDLRVDDPCRDTTVKLALAAPIFAVDQCPELLRAAGPNVTAQVRELAATITARLARQVAALDSAATVPDAASALGSLTAPEVGRLTGLTADAVRAAIRRGRLEATRDRVTGEWRISRQAVDEWRARRAA